MNSQLFRLALRASKLPQRTISSSSSLATNIVLDQKLQEEIHPKIGSREIVGYGINGTASYIDRCDFPCPAIRFKEPTAEVLKLRERERGDWKNLTLEEKKALYRASFCQTFSEINAPTGEWKALLAIILFAIAGTGWLVFFVKKFVYPPPVRTLNREWQEESLKKMLAEGQGIVSGVASKWDYEKQQWKQ